ncbi:S8 family peptidase [Amycolatopsis plumensis]|uniref:S8 family peptidase n=1 Tax=Amycolatopsis plumensis TaxID=236508 RepID=A0ABV5U785_9PSEU
MAASPQLAFDGVHEHAHLKIARALAPLPRRKPSGGGGRGRRYADHKQHARDLAQQAASLRDRHQTRERVLGINPALVMVIECNDAVANLVEALENAGLRVLEGRGDSALAAFSGDPEMTSFLNQRKQYETVLTRGGNPRYLGLFDAIDRIRPLEPSDVVDEDLAQRLVSVSPNEILKIDFTCWCTESREDTILRNQETRTALSNAEANILDSTCRYEVGLSIIRAEIRAELVLDVVRTDRISRASLLPRPLLSQPEIDQWPADRLPEIRPPARTAPLVAIIDSGIQAGNPLLAPAIYETVSAADDIADGADESGHGSLVASLAVYGSLERKLHRKDPLHAAGRILGIRVLNHENTFPDAELWQSLVERAVLMAAERGARVVNLSLGDRGHPYRPPAPVGIAAVLDKIARERDLVIVVSAGNVEAFDHAGPVYGRWLIDSEQTGLIPPAMSALALTVGALVPHDDQGARPARDSVARHRLGKAGQPSPVTRTGPGIENAIKPELSAPGGTFVYDEDRKRVIADSVRGGVVGAAGGRPDAVLARDIGTSFAAPLVTHAALRVLGRYPNLRSTSVRALLLATTVPAEPILEADSEKEAAYFERHLSGFGKVVAERAEFSSDHRAVLLSEENLKADEVHFYTVRVPSVFFQPGEKRLAIGLAFDPPTRATRLSYLSSRMSVYAYRGADVDDVRAKYAASPEEAPTELAKYKIDLEPADRLRLQGANQAAGKTWKNAWDRKYTDLVVVARNSFRWPYEDHKPVQYALAVVLEVTQLVPGLYAELRAQLEVLAEIEPEIELG